MKVINFGAGPAKLPEEVMLKVQKDLLNYNDMGISIMEMSHRSLEYDNFNACVQNTIREVMDIPKNYKILMLQGGGVGQFAAVAMNLIGRTSSADYFVTGSWSEKAAKEATKYGKVNLVLPKTDKYTTIPDPSTWNLDPNASYAYYCDNETVNGVEFNFIPEVGSIPLVVDMSSNFLTRRVDVSKFGVIFAVAQKNIGPSGVTLVIVREDLLGNPLPITPLVFDYTVQARDNSIHNTPPIFSIYVMGLVFKWSKEQGGVGEMERRALRKSKAIYKFIDESNEFYLCPVNPEYRSRMNTVFSLKTQELESEFIALAKSLGMVQLKGHKLVGGIQVSLYNAISEENVSTLLKFMEEFMNIHQE